MIGHYLSMSWRNVRRAPAAAAINVLTLGIGLACFLTAYAFVAFWDRAEHAFPTADRTFALTTTFAFANGGFARNSMSTTPERAAEALRADFPTVEKIARAIPIDTLLYAPGVDRASTAVSNGESAMRAAAVAADSEFLEIFALPFLKGDRVTALTTPSSVVLTREFATRLYGSEDPLGKSLLIGNTVDTTVTGVIADVTEPSHLGSSGAAPLPFDLLVSMDIRESLRANLVDPRFADILRQSWVGGDAYTYLLLPAARSSANLLRDQLADFVERHMSLSELGLERMEFGLMPVRELLRDGVDAELFSGDIGMSASRLLWLLGAIVLGVACVNYANLATARAARRVREVGVRKALGAAPMQVMVQHLLEAALLTLGALLIAFVLLRFTLPVLESVSRTDLRAGLTSGSTVWIFLSALALAVTLAAGTYPAFVLSRVEPMAALRGPGLPLGAKRLSMILVGIQFTAASLLLIAVLVTSAQNAELVRTGLGVSADPLVMIENPARMTKVDSATLRAELERLPQITGVTEAGERPWARLVGLTFISRTPDATGPRVLFRGIGYDFFEVMDMRVLAGRTFRRDRGDAELASAIREAPMTAGGRVVVDRAFVEELGFESSERAVGETVYIGIGNNSTPLEIIGVVESRRLTFRGAGAASAMYRIGQNLNLTIARISADDMGSALDAIDATWERLAPNVAINRTFFDESFNRAYETFLRLNQVFTGLAVTAFVISTVGLFGMATLVAGRRRREVGVRKAFGASTAAIVRLLLVSFSGPVLIANLVAWPVAYLAARAYLAAFIDPIALSPTPFVLSLVLTLAIACVAVGGQTLRVARTAPADVLRHE